MNEESMWVGDLIPECDYLLIDIKHNYSRYQSNTKTAYNKIMSKS